MRISKRTMSMILALVLALSVTAFGTVAYMTDRDTVTNTFTVGNINITVDELDTDGSQTNVTPGSDPVRDQQNNYPLIPGLPQTKDPTMTVHVGSEECYVHFRVELTGYAALKAIRPALTDEQLLTQFVSINSDWTLTGTPVVNGNVVTYEYRHATVVDASAETKILQSLFDTFTVPLEYTGSDLTMMVNAGFQLEAHGDAVQTEAFADVNAAWQAFDNQFGIVRQELSLPEELPNEDEGNEEEIIPNEDQIPETPVTDENVTE